jgi:hypothetical protein
VAEDPFTVLGVDRGAGEEELRAARRRLAQSLHPDHAGGTTEAMRTVNVAFQEALARLGHPDGRTPAPTGDHGEASVRPARRPSGPVAHDVASFTIEALPAEAFEALLVVSSWLGDVLDDDPPYQLDVLLGEPFRCWCRLDLLPDAGASTVSLTLAGVDGRGVPDLDAVRDAWVSELNTLGRPD